MEFCQIKIILPLFPGILWHVVAFCSLEENTKCGDESAQTGYAVGTEPKLTSMVELFVMLSRDYYIGVCVSMFVVIVGLL